MRWRLVARKADPSGKRRLRDEDLIVFPQTVKPIDFAGLMSWLKPRPTKIPRSYRDFSRQFNTLLVAASATAHWRVPARRQRQNRRQLLPGSMNLNRPLQGQIKGNVKDTKATPEPTATAARFDEPEPGATDSKA